MKITPIERTTQTHLRRLRDPRCEAGTASTGTHYFQSERYRCSRLAVFNVDGEKLCKLHAGDKCLRYLIDQQEDDR